MRRKNIYLLILLTIVALALSGCYIITLVEPEPQVTATTAPEISLPNTRRVSYDIYDNASAKRVVEKALLDSFSTYGIRDVKKFEKLERDRITLFVYELQPGQTDDTRYIDVPWGFISLATLTMVPYYAEGTQPIEVHIIDPSEEYDRQIRVIRTQYVVGMWVWLPSVFLHREEDETIDYQGLRSIFDVIIAEHLLH